MSEQPSGNARCANCGEARMRHNPGLYRLWCPDEKQPDMLPDGRWKTGAKPIAFGVAKGTALPAGYGVNG
jgi:hypothetical protein